MNTEPDPKDLPPSDADNSSGETAEGEAILFDEAGEAFLLDEADCLSSWGDLIGAPTLLPGSVSEGGPPGPAADGAESTRINEKPAFDRVARLNRAACLALPGDPAEMQQHLPQYPVREIIGRGGMGDVSKAEDPKLGRTVALKTLRLGLEASEEMRGRFLREATVLAQLAHPNIVPIHDLGADEHGLPFYTMKLVKGRTLQSILCAVRDGVPDAARVHSLERLLNTFRKVCDAVAFAHSRGVIHRDLKPENIMVGEFGEVLVMDWGLAKLLTGGEDMESGAAPSQEAIADDPDPFRAADLGATLEGTVMGTPQYMSPEQAAGNSAEVDQSSDIYSLGAILYAILTLRPPVEGKSVAEIFQKLSSGQITPPSAFGAKGEGKRVPFRKGEVPDAAMYYPLPHCPGKCPPAALSSVTMKALSLEKSRRYLSVNDFSADVESYQNGFATRAEEAGLMRQAALLIKRHRGISTTVLLALMAVTTLAAWFVTNVTLERNRATKALANLRGTAPTFYDQALALIGQKKLDAALEKVGYAISLAPEDARYHALRGNIQQTRKEAGEARAAYSEAQHLDPGLPYLVDNLAWCGRLANLDKLKEVERQTLLHEFQKTLVDQHRADEAVIIGTQLADMKALEFAWRQKIIEAYGPTASAFPSAGGLYVVLTDLPEVRDLTPLAGLPLVALQCQRTGVTDLSPLRGMSLTTLKIDSCKVSDIGALEGMPLRTFSARNTEISDLSALRHAKLSEVDLAGTKVKDLAALQGMPLEVMRMKGSSVQDLHPLMGAPLRELDSSGTEVRDLTPLRGAPLRKLALRAVISLEPLSGMKLEELMFGGADDLTPLRGMPLESLHILNSGVRNLDALQNMHLKSFRLYCTPKVSDIHVLSGMPLTYVNLIGCSVRDLSPIHEAPLEFFSFGDDETTNALGSEPDLSFLKGKKLMRLDLDKVTSFNPRLLEGMPLKELTLWNCGITSLDFVRGLPLVSLHAGKNAGIIDLTPLQGSKIFRLRLDGAGVKNLEPLRGLPLKELDLSGCPEPLDVSPLAFCPELTALVLPVHALNVASLRQLKNLETLSRKSNDAPSPYVTPDKSAAQFWREFDAEQAARTK